MLQRDYTYFDHTIALCSKCKEKVEGKIIFRGNNVYLQKRCKNHGEEEVLISTDVEYYKRCRNYMKPSEMPQRWNTEIEKGCPFDCGLCPDHEQHTCLAVLEITQSCDLDCNICYANSKNDNKFLSLDKIKNMVDCTVKNEGMQDVLQISGGEPTLHPRFFEVLDYCKNSKIRHLMVNTNGLKLSDENFVKKLSKYKKGFEIYLQFDSLNAESLINLRGKDLTSVRKKALENLNKYNISTTLVVALKKGVNLKEIGEIINFATSQKCVRGVTFQPIQEAGRLQNYRDDERLTVSEIRQEIINQSNIFTSEDIIPVPCHPDTLAMGYALKNKDEVVPLTRMIDPDVLLEGARNTIVFENDINIQQKVKSLFSLSQTPEKYEKTLKDMLCCLPKVVLPQGFGYENVFRVLIVKFLDVKDLEVRSVKKSCIHIVSEDEKLIPFDVYNIFHR